MPLAISCYILSDPTPALKDRFLILGVLFDLQLGSTRAITTAAIHCWSLLYVLFTWSTWQIRNRHTYFHSKNDLSSTARHSVVPEHDKGQEKTKCIPFAAGHNNLEATSSGHGPPSHWVETGKNASLLSFQGIEELNHANPECTVHTYTSILEQSMQILSNSESGYDQVISKGVYNFTWQIRQFFRCNCNQCSPRWRSGEKIHVITNFVVDRS